MSANEMPSTTPISRTSDSRRNGEHEGWKSCDEDEVGLTQPDLVTFADNDPENPVNWPNRRRWPMVIAVSLMNMISILATTTIVPAAPAVMRDFRVDNPLYRSLLVSIWELGEGVGPFAIAPLSERYGRLPVFHIGNALGLACSIASALSVNVSMLIAFRFLNGAVLAALTLAPTIIGDLFRPEERGTAMAVGMGLNLIGAFVAPVTGGFIAQALGWRWTIWLNAICIGTVASFCGIVLRETYAVKILERKAARLRVETGEKALQSEHQSRIDSADLVWSAIRPIRLFFTSFVVTSVSLYTAFTYGLAYIILTTLAPIMEGSYGFSQSVVGLSFLAPATGNIVGMLFYALTSDRYIEYKRAKEGALKPEHRLLHMTIGAVILPCGVFLYAWTLAASVQYIVPLIGTAIVGFCMMLSILPTENYLVDVYNIHSASAIAAGVILRAIFGALLPLCGPSLYENLGLGLGNSVLAIVAILFIPLVIFLQVNGHKVRKVELST